MPYSNVLHDEEMEKLVELFLKRLENLHPELKPEINKDRKALVEKMVEVLKSQNVNKRSLTDADFLKQLTLTFAAAISINNIMSHPETNPLKVIGDLLKSKGLDINDPKLDPRLNPFDPRFNLDLFKKKIEELKLSPEEKEMINNEIKKFCTQVTKDLEQSGLLKLRPSPNGKRPHIEDEMTKNMDPLSNLLGILSSRVTGTLPVVVQCYMGNGLGFTDQNPYPGTAPIDRQNDPNDSFTFGGDYQGVNASTIGRLLTFAGDAFVAEFKNELRTEHLSMDAAPRPH